MACHLCAAVRHTDAPQCAARINFSLNLLYACGASSSGIS